MMKSIVLNRIACALLIIIISGSRIAAQNQPDSTKFTINKTSDFEIDGKGSNRAWSNTAWLPITARANAAEKRTTRVKALYSPKGMYFLVDCRDNAITSTMNADFMDLWKEDVFEVFIQTDSTAPAYFEYELSPRNFELPILISNIDGNLTRWIPFHYEADRKTRHAARVSKDNNWMIEFFVPYALLRPLKGHVPASGTVWKGNFYRIDHDNNEKAFWSWQKTEQSFHDPEHFGYFIFE